MLPPVSEPKDAGQNPAATQAADPPDDPPGTLSTSQGLRVIPMEEFSVVDPIANSSRLTLPMMMAPACRKRATAVASYGGQ